MDSLPPSRDDVVVFVDEPGPEPGGRRGRVLLAILCGAALVVMTMLALEYKPLPRQSAAAELYYPPEMSLVPRPLNTVPAAPVVSAPRRAEQAPARPAGLPIRYSKHLAGGQNARPSIDELLDRPIDAAGMNMADAGGRQRRVQSGSDYLAAVAEGFEPLATQRRQESSFRLAVAPLLLLKDAAVAQRSRVDDLDLAAVALDLLPPTLGAVEAPESARIHQLERAGGCWRTAWPLSRVVTAGSDRVSIADGQGNVSTITLLAWADVNQDGWEDLVISLSNARPGGLPTERCVVLTRQMRGQVLRIVESRR